MAPDDDDDRLDVDQGDDDEGNEPKQLKKAYFPKSTVLNYNFIKGIAIVRVVVKEIVG